MIIKNLHTGKDVTHEYLAFLKGDIDKEEFEFLTGLNSNDLKIKIKD